MLLSIRDAQHALDQGECTRAEAITSQIVREDPKNAAAWHVLGLARHKLGQLEPALEALTKAADQDRRVARYHHDLGNALLDDGKIDRAISAFRRALRIDDRLAEVHNDLGAAYFQKRWHAEAEACFRKAIERKPEHGIAHANLGSALRAQGRLGEGRRAYQRALALRLRSLLPAFLRWRVRAAAPLPDTESGEDPDQLQAQALAFEDARDLVSALARMRAAVERKPERSEYQINLARLLAKSGEYDAALQAALSALKLEPGSANVHATIAGIYHPWREDLAEQAARRAVELDASSHAGHGNLAASLWGQGKLEEAVKHAREAVRLRPAHIGYRTNLGLILKDLGLMDEARALYRSMLAEAADHPKLAMDLGTLAIECDRDLEAARGWFRKAQASADNPKAILSEGIIDLLEQHFDRAWEKYKARKLVADQRYQHTIFAQLPAWDGKADCRLLVYGEQGLGDEIMYASMFPDLARRTSRITVMCDARLGALFQRSFPDFEVIGEPRGSQGERVKRLQNIDAVVAAGDLGGLFRRSPRDFPRHAGYLIADPRKVALWKERLGAGRHFGLSWIGGLQKTGRSRRSLPLEQLQPVLREGQAGWVSLQHDFTGSGLLEFPGVTQDLDELAGLIGALELVVSVCNTTVHLTGALGREVIVMAPFVPEWRYGLSGDMLWYPSARVLRQSSYGHWQGVLAQLTGLLRNRPHP